MDINDYTFLKHIRDNTRIHATNQVWAQVRVLVGDRVNSLIMDQVNTQVHDVRNHVYGQIWNDICSGMIFVYIDDHVFTEIWDRPCIKVQGKISCQSSNQVLDMVYLFMDNTTLYIWDQVQRHTDNQVREDILGH